MNNSRRMEAMYAALFKFLQQIVKLRHFLDDPWSMFTLNFKRAILVKNHIQPTISKISSSDHIILTSDHQLEIQNRCHRKTMADQKYFPFCVNEMENEETFLVSCPLYDDLRGHYLRQIESPDEKTFSALVTASATE